MSAVRHPAGARVAVVLGPGSVGPLDIALAAGADRPVTFVAAAGALDPRMRSVAESVGRVLEIDPGDAAAVAALRRSAPAGITTFSERCLALTATLAERLGLPFHDAATVTALTRKDHQRRALAAAGVDRLRCRTATTRHGVCAAVAWLAGPAVVKPLRGEGSGDTHLVNGPADVPGDLPVGPARPFVVEEYLAGRDEGGLGDYVSVESIADGGRVVTVGVTGKFALLPPFREQGQYFPCHIDGAQQRRIAALAGDAARALGVRHGLLHTEIKLTPAGPRVIEVNGRLGGHMRDLYLRALGVDLVAAGLDAACGLPVGEPAGTETGRVHYQHSVMSPPSGGLLRGSGGADRARRLDGVVGYTVLVPRGSVLPAGVMTSELTMLRGDAADHASMLTAVDRALRELTFDIEDGTGVVRTWQPSRTGMAEIGACAAS